MAKLLVAIGGHIAAALFQGDLHLQMRALGERGDVQVGVDDLHLVVDA